MSAVLEVDGISLSFGGLRVLNEVSFALEPASLLAIIGPNGAGKTSVFNCINGVYRPFEGSIHLDGEEITGARPASIAERGLARTFQNLALFVNLDVVDNLMLGRHHLMKTGYWAGALWVGRAKREEHVHRARCHELIDLLELGDHVGRPVGLLPYGVQKRIEFGRAVAMEPKVLLLDEPVAGMNVEETEVMAGDITSVREELGMAMIMVEHDMQLVMGLAEQIVCLSFGEVIATGDPATVAADPEVIAAYLGTPEDAV
ncbi:MAG: ABC transporter ATP-binding protein [Acidimicrobiia bacterium]|nr:ABC transporter ATP-binding protein [Acidimicrobiia bacterium]MDH5237019.1 ABC transporter ATP-binding protein [Acidimicrobiia bacterium]